MEFCFIWSLGNSPSPGTVHLGGTCLLFYNRPVPVGSVSPAMSYFDMETWAHPADSLVLLQITHSEENILTRITVLLTKAPSKEMALRFGDTHGPFFEICIVPLRDPTWASHVLEPACMWIE